MKEITRENYLHYGDVFKWLSGTEFPSVGCVTKKELLSSIENGCPHSKFLSAIVTDYYRSRSHRADLADLTSDLTRTARIREVFRMLGCRGFSYKFLSGMAGFPYRLRRRVDLRMALVATRDLFYPPQVRRYLARHRANHYFVYDAPAIAFALGMTTRKKWYVFIMQSDIVRRGPASVREHFRGWRKVLFANIIEFAKKSADYIYLCKEEDVLEGCHGDYHKPLAPPVSWRSIYRGTADDFGMLSTELTRGINIQLYDRRPPIYARSMYCLALDRKPNILPKSHNGAKI